MHVIKQCNMIVFRISRICAWTMMIALVWASCDAKPAAAKKGGARHVIVSHDVREFAGWPANEGCWAWGDEILVGYTVGRYVDRGEKHSIDPKGPEDLCFSRSLDGGLTWRREMQTDAKAFRAIKDGKPGSVPSGRKINFEGDGFILKMRYDVFHFSEDRGRNWQGPYNIKKFDDPALVARSNYMVTGTDSALLFLTSSPVMTPGRRGRSFVANMSGGGARFDFLSWIGKDPGEGLSERELPAFSTMPSAVQIKPEHIVCALRQRVNKRKWTDVFESVDNARTWRHISVLETGSTNPAAIVHLGGGKLAGIYGARNKPYGLRAKISQDGGKTWGKEIVLRDDGLTWDLGYPRAVVRADGTIVITYYYATRERPQQHIAATLWRWPEN